MIADRKPSNATRANWRALFRVAFNVACVAAWLVTAYYFGPVIAERVAYFLN